MMLGYSGLHIIETSLLSNDEIHTQNFTLGDNTRGLMMAPIKHQYSQLDYHMLVTAADRIPNSDEATLIHENGRVNHVLKSMSAEGPKIVTGIPLFPSRRTGQSSPMSFTLLLGLDCQGWKQKLRDATHSMQLSV
jgi:hypothetical protein